MKTKLLILSLVMLGLSACAPKADEVDQSKPLTSVWTSANGEVLDLSEYSFRAGGQSKTEGYCQYILLLKGDYNSGYFHTYHAQWLSNDGTVGTDDDCSMFNDTLKYTRSNGTLLICNVITDSCEVYH